MPSRESVTPLTPAKVWMLCYLAELRFLSLPQLARLCCPSARQDLSEKSARRHLRSLFDAGLVDVLPVSRAALAPPGAANDASLLYGSAPNIYAPTADGLRLLRRMGLVAEKSAKEGRKQAAYGPRNGLFLAHELQVRDVRVWLEGAARVQGHRVQTWKDGEAAAIRLNNNPAASWVHPDAWFVYRLGKTVLVGLVEVDRGTERGDRRWGEKMEAYGALFERRHTLQAATGYINARVLAVCPDARRRDGLTELVSRRAGAGLAAQFWFGERASLEVADLAQPTWRRPSTNELWPLISSETLHGIG